MNKIKRFIPFILIGIVILFSLGKTLQYYFYTDDFVFLYNLRNNLEFGWPYSSVLPLFRPIYNLFGTNALSYFSLALFTYFLASIASYFFIKVLTRNNLIAFLSALIFATGYIGLDQFTMNAVSIINNLNIINVCITLILLIYWIETRKLRYYFLTFFMFWFSLLLFPYRAYPLVLFLPSLELVLSFKQRKLKEMLKQVVSLFLRYIPFLIVAVQRGVFSYGTHGTENVHLLNLVETDSKVYTLFNPLFFKELFAVLGKFVLLPSFTDFFKYVPSQDFYSFVGVATSLLVTALSIVIYRREKQKSGRVIFAVFLLTIQSYVGNMFLNVDFDSNGPINRYLTISFLFYSILISLFFYLFLQILPKINVNVKKRIYVILAFFLILVLASLSRDYEERILEDRSQPAIKFFKELKTYVPALSDSNYNIFYFDRASYYPVSSRFGSVLLSAAMGNSVNLALPYGISVDSVKIVDNFEDFLRLVFYPPQGKEVSYYTFYNDESGLKNTTDDVFKLLASGKTTEIPSSKIDYQSDKGVNVIRVDATGVSSLTPLSVRLSLQATPLQSSSFTFPYSFNSSPAELIAKTEKEKIFKYLLSREKYYESAKVEAESIHIGKKNPASFLIDDNPDTLWISDQSRWEVGIKPWVRIDLSEEKNIGRVMWRQSPVRSVGDFSLLVSKDGESWEKVGKIQKTELDNGNLVIANFEKKSARFVMLSIESLASGPGPGLFEFEVVDSDFANVDLEAALRVKNNPFEYIGDIEDLYSTYNYLSQNVKIKVKSFTNKDDPASSAVLGEIPIFLDGIYHEYEFKIPQGGTMLEEIRLEANFPASFNVNMVLIENQSKKSVLDEIRKKCLEFTGVEGWKNPFDCS